MDKQAKIALVTGANRGLGLEICKELARLGFQVILTARSVTRGRQQAEKLNKEGIKNITFLPLDVNDTNSIGTLYEQVLSTWGRLDVLVNNAGVMLDEYVSWDEDLFESMRDLKILLSRTMETNAFGPLLLGEAFGPIMRKNRYGRIVNVSSSMAQLQTMQEGHAAYRLSKTALNAVTKILASQFHGANILVNSVCPGYSADTSEKSIDTVIWAATLPDDGPTGGFFRDQRPISW